MSDSPAPISAKQVTQILKRAAEIDARGDILTVDELRRIASEAGIDPAATDAAIQEVMAADEPAPVPAVQAEGEGANLPAKAPTAPSSAWIVASGAVGAATGFVTALLPEAVGITAFGAAIMYLIVRAVQSMKRGKQMDFQLQNFAVWFGLLIGATAVDSFLDDDVFGGAFVLWIVLSVVGGLLVKLGPRDKEPEPLQPQSDPDEPRRVPPRILSPQCILAAAGLAAADPVVAQEVIELPGKDVQLDAAVEEVYRVGSTFGDEWEQFGDVRSVAFDADGQLYLFDGQAGRVVVVDSDGGFRRAIGRAGEGPGEFKSPSGHAVMRDGHVVVADAGHRAYHIFGPDGTFESVVVKRMEQLAR